jgi:hypothetical protein
VLESKKIPQLFKRVVFHPSKRVEDANIVGEIDITFESSVPS